MSKTEKTTWLIAAVLAVIIVVLAYMRFFLHIVPPVPGINE